MPGTLRPKYVVCRVADEGSEGAGEARVGASVFKVDEPVLSTDPGNIDSPFVIFPRKDPAAFHALLLYSTLCEVGLGMEIRNFCEKIAQAEPVYGTQGARNQKTMQMTNIKRAVE